MLLHMLPLLWNYSLVCTFAHMHVRSHMQTHTHTHTHTLRPDRRVCTKDGLNPVHIAAHYPPQGIGTGMVTGVPTHAVSTSHQVIQVLLEYGGNSVDEQIKMLTDHNENVHKWRPLHMACSTGNESAVQELLKHIQSMFTVAV